MTVMFYLLIGLSTTQARRCTANGKPPGGRGAASLVFFHFGDSYLKTLAQETVKLSKAMDGYDKVVLLRHDSKFAGFTLSKKAEKMADIVAKPTNANIIKYLKQLAEEGYFVDIFIFSHGHDQQFLTTGTSKDDKDAFTVDDIKTKLSFRSTGCKKFPIRLVYQVNCYGSSMNQAWIDIGAKSAVGSRYINFLPTNYGRFIKEWNKGTKLDEAIRLSEKSVPVGVHTYLLADAKVKACTKRKKKKKKGCWGKCPVPKTILSKHKCAKKYFARQWDASGWKKGQKGSEYIKYSSHKVRKGRNLGKRSRPSW